MFDFLKRKENSHVLTEESLVEIRRIGGSLPPTCNGVMLKKDFEKWKYCNYMNSELKDFFRRKDEEERMRIAMVKYARLREVENSRMIAQMHEEQQRLAIEAKRKEEIKETFEEMQEILKEVRDSN